MGRRRGGGLIGTALSAGAGAYIGNKMANANGGMPDGTGGFPNGGGGGWGKKIIIGVIVGIMFVTMMLLMVVGGCASMMVGTAQKSAQNSNAMTQQANANGDETGNVHATSGDGLSTVENMLGLNFNKVETGDGVSGNGNVNVMEYLGGVVDDLSNKNVSDIAQDVQNGIGNAAANQLRDNLPEATTQQQQSPQQQQQGDTGTVQTPAAEQGGYTQVLGYCPHCGGEYYELDNFCGYCGKSLRQD